MHFTLIHEDRIDTVLQLLKEAGRVTVHGEKLMLLEKAL